MALIRPNVLRMEAYSPGKPVSEVTRELGVSPVVKLASNENPLGPSPLAVQAVKEAAERMNVYPDAAGFELKQAISERYGMPVETILLGNGSDELIHMLGLLFMDGPEDELMVGDPSFVRYDAAAHLAPSRLVKVPLAGYVHDLPAMSMLANDHTKLIFIANPNNPTGTIVNQIELETFLDAIPATATVVLDEAYAEFAEGHDGYPNSLKLIEAGRNVISLRTFSKAYGLAGIRMGFGFASAQIVDAFNRAREPFNVNALAQAAAIAALGDAEHLRRTLENNSQGLARISQALVDVGATPVPSAANFVFANLHRPARPVFEAMMAQGVVIRAGDMFGTPTCIRVSVGTEEEVDRFIEALNNVMKETVTP